MSTSPGIGTSRINGLRFPVVKGAWVKGSLESVNTLGTGSIGGNWPTGGRNRLVESLTGGGHRRVGTEKNTIFETVAVGINGRSFENGEKCLIDSAIGGRVQGRSVGSGIYADTPVVEDGSAGGVGEVGFEIED